MGSRKVAARPPVEGDGRTGSKPEYGDFWKTPMMQILTGVAMITTWFKELPPEVEGALGWLVIQAALLGAGEPDGDVGTKDIGKLDDAERG